MDEPPLPVDPQYSAAPPPRYVGYTRASPLRSDPDRLQALVDGYFGLGWAFGYTLIAVVVGFGIGCALVASAPELLQLLWIAVAFSVPMIVAGVTSYPYAKKIAYGAEWGPASAIAISIVTGLGTAFCGVFGFAIVHSLGYTQMRKYGLQPGFLGFSRKDIRDRIEQLRQAGPPPPPVLPPD